MNQKEKKIARIIETAMTEDLSAYGNLLSVMRKKIGVPFFGTRKLAAALLKEYVGDVSSVDIASLNADSKASGKLVFEDSRDGSVRLFANIGKIHRVVPGDIIREIVKRSGIDGKVIGKIDIHQNYSFIEIPEQYAEIVVVSFENARFRGTRLVIEPARRKKSK